MIIETAGSRKPSIDAFAAAAMILLTMSWGANSVAGKIAVTGLDPMLVSLLRAALAIIALLAWCRFRGLPVFARDGTLRSGVLAGLLFGLEFAAIYAGLALTSASRANLMTNTMPLFALAGTHFLLGEKATPVKIAGTIIAFIGVGIVFSDKLSLPSENAVWGDLLCIAGAMLWAATGLVIRKSALAGIAPEKTLLYQLAGAIAVSALLMPFSGELVGEVTTAVVASVLFQAFFVVAFTYSVWFWLMTKYPLSGLSSFTFLSTIFGVLFSALILGDPLTPGLVTGMTIVVIGLFLINGTIRRRQA